MFWPLCTAGLAGLLAYSLYRISAAQKKIAKLAQEQTELQLTARELSVRLEEEKRLAAEKIQFLTKAQESLTSTFKALSSDALRDTQKSFFDLAKTTLDKYTSTIQQDMQQKQVALGDLVKPLSESLKAVDTKIQELEKSRVGAYSSVYEQLKSLAGVQEQLQSETSKLSKAMRAPTARGKWGEMQLKRVIELAGMVAYCDYVEQHTFDGDERKMRPDLVVRLPNNRSIVIDAKSPLNAYLEALDCDDDDKKNMKMKEHAKQLKKHLLELGEKGYWERITPTPEFVVLFLPGESFFSAALEQDPALIEYGVDKKVLIATPTTLIALLRAVAYGWQEELVAKHAQAISELGKSLHDRLKSMTEHLMRLKRALDGSVESYNKVVASFETRVMPAARRFEEMNVSSQTPIPDLEPVEKLTRTLELAATTADETFG